MSAQGGHRNTARPRECVKRAFRGVTNARARGASDEEGARWSFQTRDCCPWEMDSEGREGCFCTEGLRHGNMGGSYCSSPDTTGGADAALHSAMLAKRLVILIGSMIVVPLTCDARRMMGSMIVLPVRRVAIGRRCRFNRHGAGSLVMSGAAHHHADRQRALDGHGDEQQDNDQKVGSATHIAKYTTGKLRHRTERALMVSCARQQRRGIRQ